MQGQVPTAGMKNGLTISDSTVDGIHILKLGGFLDGHTFIELERKLEGMLKSGRMRLVMDLSGLTYIASAGVGVFIKWQAQARDHRGSLQLANAGPNVREIFDILGLDALFTLHATLPEAVQAAKR